MPIVCEISAANKNLGTKIAMNAKFAPSLKIATPLASDFKFKRLQIVVIYSLVLHILDRDRRKRARARHDHVYRRVDDAGTIITLLRIVVKIAAFREVKYSIIQILRMLDRYAIHKAFRASLCGLAQALIYRLKAARHRLVDCEII